MEVTLETANGDDGKIPDHDAKWRPGTAKGMRIASDFNIQTSVFKFCIANVPVFKCPEVVLGDLLILLEFHNGQETYTMQTFFY